MPPMIAAGKFHGGMTTPSRTGPVPAPASATPGRHPLLHRLEGRQDLRMRHLRLGDPGVRQPLGRLGTAEEVAAAPEVAVGGDQAAATDGRRLSGSGPSPIVAPMINPLIAGSVGLLILGLLLFGLRFAGRRLR